MNDLRLMRQSVFAIVLVCGALALATDNAKSELKKGIMRGKIVDASGKPVANATIAVQEANGKIMAWTKTDSKGEYCLIADPKLALNLKPSHCRGLLEECVRTASNAAMDAARFAGSTILTPGNTVRGGAVAIASGTSGQAVGQGTAASLPTAGTTPGQIGQAAGGAATNAALLGAPSIVAPPCTHGQAAILVSAAGFKPTCLADAAYWLDPPILDKTNPVGVQAWLETIKLQATAAKDNCQVVPDAITLSDLDVQPSLVPVGGSVAIKVKFNSPDPTTCQKIRIFARLSSTSTVVELLPIAGQKDFYGASILVGPKTHVGLAILSVGALRTEPIEVKLNNKNSDPLIAFVGKTEDMNGKKEYGYDPFVMASVNRLDAKLTILAPKGK